LEFPTATPFHDEPAGITMNFRPWIIASVLALIFAYGPPLYQLSTEKNRAVPGFSPDSPVPEK
jgi:hypothetical protein